MNENIADQAITLTPRGIYGERAMVASGHPLATWSALDVLSRGGTAVDAAISADAVMGVVEPMASGVGGDLLAQIIVPGEAPVAYNGTGRAPQGLTREAIEAAGLSTIPNRHPLSVTVPGVVAGWFDLHGRFGNLPMTELLAPAIGLARAGYPVGRSVAHGWRNFADVIRMYPTTARTFRGHDIPKAGDRFKNHEIAELLEKIAAHGPAAFYDGAPAEAAAKEVKLHGGVLDADDFSRHSGNFVAPLRGRFRDLEVLECPPNTQGVAVLDALHRLSDAPLDSEDPGTWAAMVDAVAYGMERARETVADSGNTVCTVVANGEDQLCVLMSSVFQRCGSGICVPGHGFLLQNRGHGFSSFGHVNEPGPGKRAYHTVIPGAALRDGSVWAGFGFVGGPMQPQGQVQLLVRLKAWQQSLQVAIDAPRFCWRGQREVAVEPAMHEPIVSALREAGYEVSVGEANFGGAQVVLRVDDGWLGGSDPRKDGLARGF